MIYRLILTLRHLAYDKGWKKSFRAPVPTLCIGNITVGGTGKTPHTELILRILQQSDQWAYRNLAVLSRGYMILLIAYMVFSFFSVFVERPYALKVFSISWAPFTITSAVP